MDPWDVYFATLVGMILHPGYQREGTQKLTIEDCAKLADQMYALREKKCQQ